MLTGDVNLMNVTDPQVPFARVRDTLRQADVLFGNLECCFYEPAAGHPVEREGFYAPLAAVQALMVRHNERNETYVCDPGQDKEAVEQIMGRCDTLGTALTISGSELIVWKKP